MFKLIAAMVMLSASLAFAGGQIEVARGTGTGGLSSTGTAAPKAEKKSLRAPKKEAPTEAPSTAAPEKSADPK